MVMDEVARDVLGRALRPLVRAADDAGLRPNQLTLVGLLLGLGAAVAIALGAWCLYPFFFSLFPNFQTVLTFDLRD